MQEFLNTIKCSRNIRRNSFEIYHIQNKMFIFNGRWCDYIKPIGQTDKTHMMKTLRKFSVNNTFFAPMRNSCTLSSISLVLKDDERCNLRIYYEFNEPTTICEELQRTGRRGSHIFEQFETIVAR